jgi:carbon storage regulator
MLVLTRRVGQVIVVDGGIRIKVVAVQGDKVRLGIEAPDSVRVDREEVHRRIVDLISDEPIHLGTTRPHTDWRK